MLILMLAVPVFLSYNTKMMRNILTFTSLYPNNINPIFSVFVKERIKRLAGYYNIRVVAPVPWSLPLRILRRWYDYTQVVFFEIRDNIDVFHPRYFMIPGMSTTIHGDLIYRFLNKFVKKLNNHKKIDLIDAHYAYPDGYAALKIGKVLGVPVSVTIRGSDINVYSQISSVLPKLSWTLKNADAVISISENLRQEAIKLGAPENRTYTIRNGVDNSLFFYSSMKQSRKNLSLPDDANIILSIGNLVEAKGFQHIIEALHILNNRVSNVLLIIIGDGPLRHRLQQTALKNNIANKVIFIGKVEHAKLQQWYSAADIVCLASYREGIPNIILEALACGRPVVSTNVGGIPEIIIDENIGILVEPKNVNQLAEAINNALEKKWDYQAILSRAALFDWDSVTNSVLDIFNKIMNLS